MHVIGKESSKKDDDRLIVHLCQRQAWQESKARGAYHAPSIDSQGFIHCSSVNQILDVANAFYQDMPDLLLLWIDPDKVEAEIRWERVGDESFPHIYGELNVEAVIKVSELERDADGYFSSI
jgi:uncharacterized protein (DUF952 family)